MRKLYQYIFDYLQKRQPQRIVRFPHFDRPLKIMVIYESDVRERNDTMKAIRQDLLRRQMDITMWGYVEKKEIVSLILPQSRILGLQDYNWLGKPKKVVLHDLQAEHYDLLIDLTTHPCLPMRYIAMYTHADFKAGLNLGEGIHDMLIAPPDQNTEQDQPNVRWLYNMIVEYLTMIQSND